LHEEEALFGGADAAKKVLKPSGRRPMVDHLRDPVSGQRAACLPGSSDGGRKRTAG